MNDQTIYLKLKDSLVENERLNWVTDYKNISRERFDQELVFCLMTPQTKARAADGVMKAVNGNIKDITVEIMSKAGVRFAETKWHRIQTFMNIVSFHHTFVNTESTPAIRAFLYRSIHGFGLKEAAHFCRNAGRGDNIAIVDRHILNCYINRFENKWEGYELLSPAYQYAKGVFNKELTLTENRYCIIEECIVNYSKRLLIPEKYLDMIWWSEKSGEMFK